MKLKLTFFVLIISGLTLIAKDVSSQNTKSNLLVKKGWSFGALPATTFDTDLGFQYGALVNLFHYGDGSRYPEYNHSLYFEFSRFTKGSGVYRFYYVSDRLIKGLDTSVDFSYMPDKAYDFYGFNGYDAVFNKEWIDEHSDDYKSRMFYKLDQKFLRFKLDVQGDISGEKFRWIAGLNFLNFNIGEVDINKLNKGKAEDDKLPDVDGLYTRYKQWGIISDEDSNGGFVPTFKVGLAIDSRDNKPHPMSGIWSELVMEASPRVLGAESSFSKLSLTHRQYFTLIEEDLSFAYRLAYQTTISGKVPFYYQPQIITTTMKGSTSEGLGGSKTLRGIRRNRIVGDGIFYGNAELRWKFARFNWRNNSFYLGLNGFVDFGKVTKKISIPTEIFSEFSLQNNPTDYFVSYAEKMHISYGTGLRFAMNENFILAIDYGIVSDKRDGDSGFYMGMNYLF